MEERINDLARAISIAKNQIYTRKIITDAVNEVIELAAMECDKEAKRLHEIGTYEDDVLLLESRAYAIRKLKVYKMDAA